MTAEIISGTALAKSFRENMTKEVATLKEKGLTPHLTVILIGDDPASHSYVSGKEKASKEIGISSEIIRLDASISEQALIEQIKTLNANDSVHGILVQLPTPDHIDDQKIIETIDPKKDVDGFHPINIGHMMLGEDTFLPCTPFGIVKMIESTNIDIEGKHVVVIGRSNIVGKPVGQLLLNKNATVTYCHSRTTDLQSITKQADILIVAVGKEHVVNRNHVKAGAVVIDVGVNRTAAGTLTGDVDFEDVKPIASHITPVPGGVGPMTITMLLENTIKAAKRLSNID